MIMSSFFRIIFVSSGLFLAFSGLFLASSGLFVASSGLFLASSGLFLASSGFIFVSSGLFLASSKLFLAFSGLFLAFSGLFLASSGLFLASTGLFSRSRLALYEMLSKPNFFHCEKDRNFDLSSWCVNFQTRKLGENYSIFHRVCFGAFEIQICGNLSDCKYFALV